MKNNMIKQFIALVILLASPLVMAQQNFDDIEIQALKVRDNIYMLVGSGGNITVQIGAEGVLVIDTQYAELSDKILAKIRELSDKPLRYIINTHHHGDHVGGNENIKNAGFTLSGGNVGAALSTAGQGATILAHENVLLNLASDENVSTELWPTLTYFSDKKDIFFNGEGVRIIHQPNAHTNGDSIIFFRKSDVITTGDAYITSFYPFIDMSSGGTLQGFIDASNAIIDLIIPEYGQDGGTLVIPGHGRLSDIGDVINWREMLTIVRDRIKDMKDRGMSLEEVLAAKPTRDYDPRWAGQGIFSTENFVTAAYMTLED
ncbi:MAG: MBL fold metallo-hydrolase [Gammaproteobacteria bacterium]|jgi:glyoxylase-like metal-dependent hydrolase (beta-lactamase superfamily II)|nr:MBL fold metallo-hydrolase [Gammaproteobacteria bacterium]MBT6042813.1 MBL fold metallo-hydrolase [Gammaproteobacteria bacterium]